MKSKYLLAPFVLCAAVFTLYSCGGGSTDGNGGSSDMAGTPTNGVSQSTDKADAVIGGTDDSVIPGLPDITTTPGNVSDMPNTDEPGGSDGMLGDGATDSRDTTGTTAATTTAPTTTAPSTTAPAVRPPEGK